MGCTPANAIIPAIIGNRFRKRRRHLPSQPDQYCHCTDCGPTPEESMDPLFTRIGSDIQSSNRVLLAADSDQLFVCEGAVTFTLPAAAEGLQFSFFQTLNNDMTIVDDNSMIVVRGNNGASSVAFSTANQKIGAACSLIAFQDSSMDWRWLFFAHCNHTLTIA